MKRIISFVFLSQLIIVNIHALYIEQLQKVNNDLYEEMNALPFFDKAQEESEKIARLYMVSVNPGVKEAFSLILNGQNLYKILKQEPGNKDYIRPNYKIPQYNTALELLYTLAANDSLEDNDLAALSISISNAFIITFGNAEVQDAVKAKSIRFLKFLREIQELQQKNNNIPLSRYPLEALVQMCKLWGFYFYGPFVWDVKDKEYFEENFSDFYDHKINMIYFNWATIDIDILYKVREYLIKKNAYTLKPEKALLIPWDFIYTDFSSYYIYPDNKKTDPEKPYTYMEYRGVVKMNTNWNNPNYIFEKVFSKEKYYGWCTDTRLPQQFLATALGIASVQAGWRIAGDIMHVFPVFYVPEFRIWKRDYREYMGKDDYKIPIFLAMAPLNQATYWNHDFRGNEKYWNYYHKTLPNPTGELFYDMGIPGTVFKDLTFQGKTLTEKTILSYTVDTDKDCLGDWMEENEYDTDPLKLDSDNDTYSDAWELMHCFNPADRSSPGLYNPIAVDGLALDIKKYTPVIMADKKGDYAEGDAVYDIKEVAAVFNSGYLCIGGTFYNAISANRKPLHLSCSILKVDSKENLWLEWEGNILSWAATYKKGEELEKWKTITGTEPLLTSVQYAVRDEFEILVPGGLLGTKKIDIYINASTWKKDKLIWSSDDIFLVMRDSSKRIDAALPWSDGKAYLFIDDQCFCYDVKTNMPDPGYPKKISACFPGIWEKDIDAATAWGNGKVWFFKGPECIRYDISTDSPDPGYPKLIRTEWPGLWEDGIDAAINWGNGKAYFFKGREYIRFNIEKHTPDAGYPSLITCCWSGLWSDGVDACLVWNKSKALLFRYDDHIFFDRVKDQTDPGFPAPVNNKTWPGLFPDF